MDYSHFDDHGYQVVRNVFDLAFIDSIRGQLESKIHETLAPALAEIGCSIPEHIVREVASAIADEDRFARLSKPTRDALSGHFSFETRMSEEIRAILRYPKFQEVIRGALKTTKFFAHMPPTARFVLPQNIYAGVPPHQDVSYNKHLSEFIIAWMPLVDIDEMCGGVTVFHGSGNAPERLPGNAARGFWFGGVDVDGFEPRHCTIQAGDILLLNKFVIHASMPNRSDKTRLSIDFRFFDDKNTSTKHYLDMQSMVVNAP